MHCIYFRCGVISLSLCLVNTLPLWWVDGCQFCFSANIQWLSEPCFLSCPILFSVNRFHIYVFDELFLNVSNKIQSFLSEILILSELFWNPPTLTDSHGCLSAADVKCLLLSSSCSLSFETSPQILRIHRHRLVVSSPSPSQSKHGISISRAVCLSRQKVNIPDSQSRINHAHCSAWLGRRKPFNWKTRKKYLMGENIEVNLGMWRSASFAVHFPS